MGMRVIMKALVVLLLLESLGLVWCCFLLPWATNVARFGEASQSSTLGILFSVNSSADRAIDGVTDQNWYHGSCSHTFPVTGPWWRLDMKQSHKIVIVIVYARSDGFPERMMGAEVRIGDSPDDNNPVCGKISNTSNLITTFCCDEMEGQYVSVVVPGVNVPLTLCEVEVYDDSMYETCW